MLSAILDAGQEVRHTLRPGRQAWVQVARGSLTVNDTTLTAGDGAAITDETAIEIAASSDAEVLLFDLA